MRGSHHMARVQHPKPCVVQADRPARNAHPAGIAPAHKRIKHVALGIDNLRHERLDFLPGPDCGLGAVLAGAIFGEIGAAMRVARLQEPARVIRCGRAGHVGAHAAHAFGCLIQPDVVQIARIGLQRNLAAHAPVSSQAPPITMPLGTSHS